MGTAAVLPYVGGYVDPTIARVGPTKLRTLNAAKLRALDSTLVVYDNETPVAVVVKYEDYLQMQEQRLIGVQQLLHESEVSELEAGLRDLKKGETYTLSDIRESFKRRNKRRGRERENERR